MRPVREFCFTAAGSMTDPEFAAQLAVKYQNGTGDRSLLAPAGRYWKGVTRNLRITGGGSEGAALDLLVPWLAHNAIIHLDRAPRARTIHRRRLGNPRRLPGAG